MILIFQVVDFKLQDMSLIFQNIFLLFQGISDISRYDFSDISMY